MKIITVNHNKISISARGDRAFLFFFKHSVSGLGTVVLEVPPLRERREDIMPLCEYFIKKINEHGGNYIAGISKEASEVLVSYSWSGNVRELKNVIESAAVFSKVPLIDKDSLPAYITGKKPAAQSIRSSIKQISEENPYGKNEVTLKEAVEEFEADFLRKSIEKCSNKTALAENLGITRQTLINKLHKYALI